jgi:hypothetical protein
MRDELATLDATASAEMVRRGEVSPAELVEAAIARIEKINGDLNAVITPLYEKARAAVAAGLPDGPFRGVPFLLKDLDTLSAGDPFHGLVKLLKRAGYVPDHSSFPIRGWLPLEVPPRECGEAHPVRLVGPGNFTESDLSDLDVP